MLDLGCGTGLNFELILDGIGVEGVLIGVDYSAKMLAQAQEKVERQGWDQVRLLQRDTRQLDRSALDEIVDGDIEIHRILCTLGLSVFPEWQLVFKRTFEMLSSGGLYCVMDLYNDQKTFQTRVVNMLAGSNISCRVWEPLEQRSNEYEIVRYKTMHGDEVVVPTGLKP